MIEFEATIKKAPDSDHAFVEVPMEISSQFEKGVLFVKATFDGEPYEGRMLRWGTPHHLVNVTRDVRKKIGKQPGDTVKVVVSEWREKR